MSDKQSRNYSTYNGYIPNGYHFYYWDGRKEKPVINGVDRTWWRIFSADTNSNIVLNDSFSGSTICNTVRESHSVESSFISRIDKYISEGFFAENKIDTIIIFGGTNDSWINAPIGNNKYCDRTNEDLKSVLPAFCYLIEKAKTVVNDITVIINTGLKPEIVAGFIEACEKYGARYLALKDIEKENGHPTENGMKQISDQVKDFIG